MYLKKLVRHSKPAAAVVVLFFIAEIFINLKTGIFATPVMIFGMYSGTRHIDEVQQVNYLMIDGKLLKSNKLSITGNDLLLHTADYLQNGDTINAAIASTFHGLTARIGVSRFHDLPSFQPGIDSVIFKNWYKEKLQQILPNTFKQAELFSIRAQWKNEKLTAIDQPSKILTIERE